MQAVSGDILDLDAMHAEACKERDEAADLLYKAVLLLRCGQKGDNAFLERCKDAMEKRDDRREAAGLPRSMPKRQTKATPTRVPMSEVTKELGDPSTWEADDKDYADDLARRAGYETVPDRRKAVVSEQPDQNRRSAVQTPSPEPDKDTLGRVAYRTWMTFPIGETVEGEGASWERLSEDYRSTWRHVAGAVASIARERAAKVCEDEAADPDVHPSAQAGLLRGAALIRRQLWPIEMCPFGCGYPVHNATCAPMRSESTRDLMSYPSITVKLGDLPPGPGMGAASCLPTTLGEVWVGETRGQFVGSVVEPGKSHCFKCGKEFKEHTWPILCPGEPDEVAKLRARITEVQADGTKKHDAMVEAKNREAWHIYERDQWRTRAMLWRAALERAGIRPEEPKT